MTKTELRKKWALRVAAYKASGQSTSTWCAANNLKPRQLWYWLQKYKNLETPAVKPSQLLSVEVGGLKTSSTQGDDDLLVKVGRATIEVKPGSNPSLLSDLVRTMAALC
jgi:hypothetical protein